MYTDYVMIDYENVQRPNLEQFLNGENAVKVMLFVGAAENQKSIPTYLFVALHNLGERAELVEISRSEPEALDFHIAYYIGRLSVEQPSSRFHIVSNDKGYEALTDHLRAKHGVEVRLHQQESNVTPPVPAAASKSTASRASSTPKTITSLDERARYVFSKIKNSKPSTPDTLKKHIGSMSQHLSGKFGVTINGRETDELVIAMKRNGLIKIDANGKVTYKS